MKPFESKEIVKGTDVVLEGTVSGSAPFEISCFKDSKQIRNDRRHIISLTKDIAALQILKFEPGDVGKYQCTVGNEVGQTSCDFLVTMKGSYEEGILKFFLGMPVNIVLTTLYI